MPDPPSVSIIARYVFENPWPLAVVLLAIAAVLGWQGAREGLWKRVQAAGLLVLIAAGVVASAALVTTAGEHGKRITTQFVEAAVANDLTGANRLLSIDATLHIGSPKNPGIDLAAIQTQLARLGNYQIVSNRISGLRGFGLDGDHAQVHLACITDAGGIYSGNVPSQWVLHVRRESDGTWLIERITCVTIAGRTPSFNLW